MPIKSFRPLTPSGRFTQLNQVTDILTKKRPERSADRAETQDRRPQ